MRNIPTRVQLVLLLFAVISISLVGSPRVSAAPPPTQQCLKIDVGYQNWGRNQSGNRTNLADIPSIRTYYSYRQSGAQFQQIELAYGKIHMSQVSSGDPIPPCQTINGSIAQVNKLQ